MRVIFSKIVGFNDIMIIAIQRLKNNDSQNNNLSICIICFDLKRKKQIIHVEEIIN